MKVITILSGLLTPIIALIAVYIAYQQHRIGKKKLNLDLYERRYSVFSEVKKLLKYMNENSQIDTIEIQKFMFRTNDRKFLFDSDITAFIEVLKDNALALSHATEHLKKPEQYKGTIAEDNQTASRLEKWFTEAYEGVENRFMEYLEFKKIK